MPKDRVIIVHLRRPRSRAEKPDEMRSDPFWEFGSFGITTCHGKNLMHPDHAEKLNGARFAFAQGGREGTKLVYLTPPVKIKKHGKKLIEAKWSPKEMPFRYSAAPVLVSNTSNSDFPLLETALRDRRRSRTVEGEFGSRFRSRTEPLDVEIAEELLSVYARLRKAASHSPEIASCYADALPWLPPKVDKQRRKTYLGKVKEAEGEKAQNRCGNRKRMRCGVTSG